MKNIITLFLFIFFSSSLFGQYESSSCDAPDSIQNLYRTDATRLVVRELHSSYSIYMDSIEIPEEFIEEKLDDLIAIYNVGGLPARDTVINLLNIHTWSYPKVSSFYLLVENSASYFSNLEAGIIPCGNSTIDSLALLYEFGICDYFPSSSVSKFKFCSENYYNLLPLTEILDTVVGVSSASLVYGIGSGNDITFQQYSNYSILTFSHGWGDCPSYCINNRFWEFRVYDDCSVSYGGSYGNILPDYWTNIKNTAIEIGIQPNPFSNTIKITGVSDNCSFSVYNIFGQEVKKGHFKNFEITNLDFLPAGQYVIKINDATKFYSRKIIKI